MEKINKKKLKQQFEKELRLTEIRLFNLESAFSKEENENVKLVIKILIEFNKKSIRQLKNTISDLNKMI